MMLPGFKEAQVFNDFFQNRTNLDNVFPWYDFEHFLAIKSLCSNPFLAGLFAFKKKFE